MLNRICIFTIIKTIFEIQGKKQKFNIMKKIIIVFIAFIGMSFWSCEEEGSLVTDAEIIQGLKEALRVGTDSSVNIVSAMDGYYKDELIKIILPEEAEVVYNALEDPDAGPILDAAGVDDLVDDVVLGINRSAEYAADSVAPIFWDAIVSITIADGKEILYGADNAATVYLQTKTNDQIKGLFKPILQEWLDKPLFKKSTSTNDLWVTLTTTYNDAANSIAGQVAGINAIPDESTTEDYLADHSTQKALDGLFLKVADEEKRIRENPWERVTEILEKVFSLLD